MPCSTFASDDEFSPQQQDEVLVRKRKTRKEKRNNGHKEKRTTQSEIDHANHIHLQHELKEDEDWFPINPFLTCDQRGPTPCYKSCVKSAFQNNTEACNVWTHFIAGLVMVYSWYRYLHLPSSSFVHEFQEKLVASIIYSGFVICFMFSSVFHTLYCHSKSVYSITLRMDLAGILIASIGSYAPWLYYSFYHDHASMIIYSCAIVTMSPMALFVLMQTKYLNQEHLLTRIAMETILPFISVVGFAQVCMRDGFIGAWEDGHKYYLHLIMWNIAGIIFLAANIPERFISGRFDGWIHSHPIFHVLTSFAAYSGILFTHRMRENLLEGM